jgi:hypothetical protein
MIGERGLLALTEPVEQIPIQRVGVGARRER